MGSRTRTIVEWRDREGKDQQFSTERQDWGLCLFVCWYFPVTSSGCVYWRGSTILEEAGHGPRGFAQSGVLWEQR